MKQCYIFLMNFFCLLLLVSCSSHHQLTVTSIVERITFDTTTTEELVNYYGLPHAILTDKKLIEKTLMKITLKSFP